jgi:hypothetical protein
MSFWGCSWPLQAGVALGTVRSPLQSSCDLGSACDCCALGQFSVDERPTEGAGADFLKDVAR